MVIPYKDFLIKHLTCIYLLNSTSAFSLVIFSCNLVMSFCNFSIRRLLLANCLLALLALRNAFRALFAFLALAEAELASLKASVRLVASSLVPTQEKLLMKAYDS